MKVSRLQCFRSKGQNTVSYKTYASNPIQAYSFRVRLEGYRMLFYLLVVLTLCGIICQRQNPSIEFKFLKAICLSSMNFFILFNRNLIAVAKVRNTIYFVLIGTLHELSSSFYLCYLQIFTSIFFRSLLHKIAIHVCSVNNIT